MTETKKLREFINNSPSPYHVVRNTELILEGNGFEKLSENRKFNIRRGGSYYVERNGSALIAFTVPESADCFSIISAHTDSPVLRIKPNPETSAASCYTTLNTEVYGGMIEKAWFDRPLSIAGRIFARNGNGIDEKLVNIDRDLVLIPSLAIHMNRRMNEDGMKSVQKEMLPLFADGFEKGGLYRLISKELSINENDILDSDLIVYNREKGTIWGCNEEFFSAPRIDDQCCAFTAITAISDSCGNSTIPMAALFDNEEIGSSTQQGALSDFLKTTMRRIMLSLGMDEEDMIIAAAKSFMLSADNGHAVHPNYAEKADITSRPRLNGGVLIKYSGNMKYSTDGRSGSYVRKLMDDNSIPYQVFANNSDIPGGSTLGNLSSQKISMETADVGIAQLAMHSPYESAGTKDTEALLALFRAFLNR